MLSVVVSFIKNVKLEHKSQKDIFASDNIQGDLFDWFPQEIYYYANSIPVADKD